MATALLFTIDVEEFDLPGEYGIPFPEDDTFALGEEGLGRLAALLDRHRVPATLFATASFARRFPETLRTMQARGSEIGLHAAEHRHDYGAMPPAEARSLLGAARAELRERFRAPVEGYRANRFRPPPRAVLRELGFRWTSNLHPAWVPGAYDNRHRPRTIHQDDGLLEVPVSATPRWRLPVSWFWMRNLGLAYLKAASRRAWHGTGYLHVYIHPWEAADLPRLPGLPLKGRLSVRRTGGPFLKLLDGFLSWAARQGLEPRTIGGHLTTLEGERGR